MFLHSQCIISGSYLSIAAANLQLTLLGEEGSCLPNSDSRCDKKTETEEKLSCMPDEHHAKNFTKYHEPTSNIFQEPFYQLYREP